MTICPVALLIGCAKCPVVNVCPLKSSLGDYRPPPPPKPGRPKNGWTAPRK